MEKIRLDRFLSSQLNISRSDAKKLIKKSRVFVNGECSLRGEQLLCFPSDVVTVDGKDVEYKKFVYIMMNKPKGVVSATDDGRDKTVIDLLSPDFLRERLFPAGRLDKDTTGFVLITDDGLFAHDILSPSHHVEKTYLATLEKDVSDAEIKLFNDGMTIGDERFKPALLQAYGEDKELLKPIYEIKISEGRYHQIKRMFLHIGNRVLRLHRIAIGKLKLDSELKPGEYRHITPSELELIKKK